jgi:ribosome maturation factor RimP
MSINETLIALLSGPLAAANLELVDLETASLGTAAANVQVLVEHCADHPLGGRIDLDGVAAATRLVDEVLEAADPIPGAYTLEVSSPGLERPLRIPAHFQRFIGTEITVKTVAGTPGERRMQGVLERADLDADGDIVVNGVTISYASIDRARTVFVWGPAPKPTGAKPKHPKAKSQNTEPVAAMSQPISVSSSTTSSPEVTP